MSDNKTMAQADSSVGRTVEAAMKTKEMPVDSIANYYDFPSSNTQSFDTYSQRASALEAALGNKDSVQG